MDVIIKGRRTDVQERFRTHVSAKLGKISKLDAKAMRVDVEISLERNPRQSDRRERVELTIRSRGPVIRAEAAADDRYVAFERALAKLEARLRRASGRRKARHGPATHDRATAALWAAAGRAAVTPLPVASVVTAAESGWPPPVPGISPSRGNGFAGQDDVPIQMEGDAPVVVREKFHPAAPMSIDQALLEMELVGHDFYLFRDEATGHPSVVYRRRGYQYGLIRLVEEQMAGQRPPPGRPAHGV